MCDLDTHRYEQEQLRLFKFISIFRFAKGEKKKNKKYETQKSHLREISLDRRPRLSKPTAISSSTVDFENSYRVVGVDKSITESV